VVLRVTQRTFQVVLSGEGSDEIFAGYQWFPLDYLCDADLAAASLGLSLPSDADRPALSQEFAAAKGIVLPNINTTSLQKSDGPRSLLNISAHLSISQLSTSARVPLTAAMFPPDVLQVVGNPRYTRCVEEGINGRVRYNSVSGYWHSLNVALVRAAVLIHACA
jgi:asparagine synthetase B (glutamine-hydrolysing)